MKGDQGLGGIVVQGLADDQHRLAVAVALGVGIGEVGGQRDVARHLLPEVTELVARVPDVIAGRGDGVGAGPLASSVAGRAGHEGRTDVGLALEHADRRGDHRGRAMEVGGRRNLLVGGGVGIGPVRRDRRSLRLGGARQGDPGGGQDE
jgi:hypothetical protein